MCAFQAGILQGALSALTTLEFRSGLWYRLSQFSTYLYVVSHTKGRTYLSQSCTFMCTLTLRASYLSSRAL